MTRFHCNPLRFHIAQHDLSFKPISTLIWGERGGQYNRTSSFSIFLTMIVCMCFLNISDVFWMISPRFAFTLPYLHLNCVCLPRTHDITIFPACTTHLKRKFSWHRGYMGPYVMFVNITAMVVCM